MTRRLLLEMLRLLAPLLLMSPALSRREISLSVPCRLAKLPTLPAPWPRLIRLLRSPLWAATMCRRLQRATQAVLPLRRLRRLR